MLIQNPILFSENGHIGPFGNATPAGAGYTPHDLTVTVTALPSSGIVLKGDTPVSLGQRMTAADLAALKFAPAGYGSVMYVAQNCEPTQIPVKALFDSSVLHVTIIELPSNGTVLLSDGTTCVSQGQSLHVAQLDGLLFRPASDACGKLSLLQCCTLGPAETSIMGSVLLAVGPDAPSFGGAPVAGETGKNGLAPFAVALLLDTALSSSNTAVASLTDVSPATAMTIRDVVSAAVPFFDWGFAQPFDVLALGPASGEKESTGSETTQVDLADLKRIGSGSSPVPATPASTSVLTGTALPSDGVAPSTPGPLLSTSAPLTVTNASPITTPQIVGPQITRAPNISPPNINAPNISGQAPSVPATVSPTVSLPPPVANNDSGFAINEDGSITIAASALLANDTDPSGFPLSITAVGSAVNGTVSYNMTAQAITFVPTAGYSGAASFSYSVGDANGGVASANVSLFVNPTLTESLFNPNAVPALVTVNDPSSVELGVKFTADANGLITGLRFYKGPQNTGPHVADLWSSNGTLLATASFGTETASGWQQVNFSSPVAITAETIYVASYHTNGNYSADSGYFNSSLVSGDLTAPAGGNGVYAYGSASIFPTNTYGASNYWVDVVYSKSLQPLVANNDSGFVATENGSVTIAASTLLANDTGSNGLPLTITGVSNSTNGTASYNANTQSVTFIPNAGYAGSASFTYSIADSGGGTASASASLIVNDPSTTSLFSPTSTPAITTVNDPNPVELGVKFQAATDGEITGLLFYKGPANTGPHVADLWSSTGTLLATATFTNETASGWQQVNFAAPVAITAGTTYVASYHTNGEYSADPNLFAAAQTNGPLTALSSSSSGGNGVYAYGGTSLFPTNSFNSTSYGVDVVFKAQLAA